MVSITPLWSSFRMGISVRRLVALGLAVVAILVVARGPAGAPEPAPLATGTSQPRYLTGQLLVATRKIGDPRFFRSVIYMVRHNETGAMGLVVNRVIGTRSLREVLQALESTADGARGDIRVHYGGPVQPGQGFVLHSPDYVENATLHVDNRAALTSTITILEAIARGEGPRHRLFAFGYAGWAPGQLEAEIKAESWVTVAADQALVFGDDAEGKWRRAMAKRGVDL